MDKTVNIRGIPTRDTGEDVLDGWVGKEVGNLVLVKAELGEAVEEVSSCLSATVDIELVRISRGRGDFCVGVIISWNNGLCLHLFIGDRYG